MNDKTFSAEIIRKHSTLPARVIRMVTSHGVAISPCFMPVGTKAAVSSLTAEHLHAAKAQIILGGNTYHMIIKPGLDLIRKMGGMHRFMGWNGPMLTDSGGYQIFSLSRRGEFSRIDEHGASFKDPRTGGVIYLTPRDSIQAQKIIGADIIMALDYCTPDSDNKEFVRNAMQRTHIWLMESLNEHLKDKNSAYGYSQALFGIIQGGGFDDLRNESAKFVVGLDALDGIAIGGETIGFDMKRTVEVLRSLNPLLPEHKPRYTMGVGAKPSDLINVVREGIDMFDCVAPTRNARHGALYSGRFVRRDNWLAFVSEEENERIDIGKAAFADDDRPVMEECQCLTCAQYSRAYLHYLLKTKDQNYYTLATMHNIHVMEQACEEMRSIILGEGGDENRRDNY